MKIAVYQPRVSYYVGGGEVVPLEQAKYLSKLGHNITIVTGGNIPGGESNYFKNFKENNLGIDIKYVEINKKFRYIYDMRAGNDQMRWDLETFHVGREAYKFFLENKFDIVGIHYLLDVIAIPADQEMAVHLHGHPSCKRYDYNIWTSFTKNFCSDSQYILDKWRGLSDLPLVVPVTRNGIDSKKFIPLQIEKKYDALYFGRLVETKGVSYLIEALETLKDEFSFKVAIAGKGPEELELKKMTSQAGLSDKVVFLGFIEDDDLVNLYNSTKIAVFPSFGKEGVLTTMLEAASCGVPVITTSNSSMEEFLKHEVNGLLVKPQNARDIADALSLLWADDNKREKLGKASRDIIEKEWGWSVKIKDVESFYDKAINERL